MSIKAAVLLLLTLIMLYRLFRIGLQRRSRKNPVPESVRDVYDAPTYEKWLAYSYEKLDLSVVSTIAGWAVNMVLFATNAYAWAAGLLAGNIYTELFAAELFSLAIDTAVGTVFEYVNDMVIEQKYGFNRMTMKTFVSDRVKELVISVILMTLLMSILAAIHTALGDMLVAVFTLAVFALMVGITFLAPMFSKIFNKFTDLEDGELRDRLTELLTKNGYTVRGIRVMDASRRTTKSNAYFTGFGRMKTIVLYDTLLENMDADEICAVFAHELGHGLNRDTIKMQAMSFVNVLLMAVLLWLTVRTPELFFAFGFERVNYAFAFLLASSVGFEVVLPLFGVFIAWYSRRAEYLADAQAVREGYGDTLIRALKKITAENFGHLAPDRLTVVLEYSHPPLADRIEAIRRRLRA